LVQVDAAVEVLRSLGHRVVEVELPIGSWESAFGPLVLADEWRYRGELVPEHAAELTRYARRTLEAAAEMTAPEIAAAREKRQAIRAAVERLFDDCDALVTPTTAVVAFPLGQRPTAIGDEQIDTLWGPFPFTAPFNVAGVPAASVPCGLSDGLPVGVQIAGPRASEGMLVDLCEDFERAASFPLDDLRARWSVAPL
jgi:Asp-tRNA(Asn)/Glu-tRNA(Gln) amidotransferase A subunit family amidase